MRPLISIPVTLALIYRSYTRKSLTPIGILGATFTATVHALHPSPLPFTLLVLFFLLGTTATKIKHEIKATLTVSSTGSSGGEGPRTAIQVLANSGVASALTLVYILKYGTQNQSSSNRCFGGSNTGQDILMLGIIANYAAVTADTLSSELGILSRSKPRLITAPWKTVPAGTNGGVTMAGLASGMAGSFIIGLVTVTLTNFCNVNNSLHFLTKLIGYTQQQGWGSRAKLALILAITVWGTLGSVLDSLLGAALQASVVDKRTGKVVEGAGGTKVLTHPVNIAVGKKGDPVESRSIHSGRDILDNNQVNLLMALLMSLGAMISGSFALA